MPDLATRARTLLDLHTASEILVLVNVWDVVSARVVVASGAPALATASHSIAATFGYEDGENIPLDLHLDMVRRIAADPGVEGVPMTMDMEAGYGDAGETARRAIEAGVVGGNLEDELKPLDDSVAAVEAVLRAGRDAGIDFVLNARTDAMLRAGDDRSAALEDAVRRGRAYLEAGAPVVFVPGVVAREEVERLVDGLGRGRLTLITVPGASLPARDLQQLGVARVSSGPFTQRVALTALQDAARELLAGGTLPDGTRNLN